jgi:hypothetical protein
MSEDERDSEELRAASVSLDDVLLVDNALSKLKWNVDHAASGCRLRAWFRHAEVLVYDDGAWEIRPNGIGHTTCQGDEPTQVLAMRRALHVYAALFAEHLPAKETP